MATETTAAELKMDSSNLYRDEVFTDPKME